MLSPPLHPPEQALACSIFFCNLDQLCRNGWTKLNQVPPFSKLYSGNHNLFLKPKLLYESVSPSLFHSISHECTFCPKTEQYSNSTQKIYITKQKIITFHRFLRQHLLTVSFVSLSFLISRLLRFFRQSVLVYPKY